MPQRIRHREWVILDRLAGIILDNVEGCVVDIGIGPSTEILRWKTKRRGIRQHTCDIVHAKCDWARSVGCIVYEMKSVEFIKRFDDPPIALLFIDGEHLVETVLTEVTCLLPKLAEYGVIFLHDTYPPKKWVDDEFGEHCGTVYRARESIEAMPDLQIFTFPFTAGNAGLSIIGKKLDKYWQ